MDLVIIITVLLLFYLLITSKEHLELKHKHFPQAYFPEYVNNLEVTAPRMLKPCDKVYRIPPHLVDMKNQFMVRDDSNVIFI
jgi:hypothetical protein